MLFRSDLPLDEKIREQVEALGADGALLSNHSGSIHRVNFIEKILATVLSKVSNFIPEAGIWMNTQRPEWNDANNALVGNGVSMVTLYYLRRFLRFFEPILDANSDQEVAISKEMATFFSAVSSVLTDNKDVISTSISDSDRKTVTDGLGIAGSYFRDSIYENGFSGESPFAHIKEFPEDALVWLGTIPHFGLKSDMFFHVVHRTRLRNYRFARIEFNFYDLHIISDQFVIYFMTVHRCNLERKVKDTSICNFHYLIQR